jgi:hypothetical protein
MRVSIPHNITAQWSEFVAEWCLGIQPVETPAEVERAFDALRRLWPEFLARLEAEAAQGHRDASKIVAAITRGLTIAACESLDGFRPVMDRVRREEKSAYAELEFAAALVRCGFTPRLEPRLGRKSPDCLVEVESKQVYAEVIAPERSAEIRAAEATAERMATVLVERTTGTRTEVLLSGDPGAQFDDILDAVTATLPDGRVHNVEGIARVRRDFLGSQPPNVGPVIANYDPRPGHDPRPAIGVARMTGGGGGVFTSATVRLPVTDERAHRLLSKELSHFSSTERNILVIRTTEAHGGMKWWWPLTLRWFQPSRNRRIGAIVLYEHSAMMYQQIAIRQRWRVIENPYAYMPVPRSLINAIGTLDESAAFGKG